MIVSYNTDMSTYISLEGTIEYKDQMALDSAVQLLEEGGWMVQNRLVDECGYFLTEYSNVNGLEISFPSCLYRNIGCVLTNEKLLRDSTTNHLVWTCTDGDFVGGVIDDGVQTISDLEQWAKENSMNPPSAIETDEYLEWMDDVERAFSDSNES